MRRHGWSALISVVVAGGTCLGAVGLGYSPKLGLDLQGGLQVVLHPCEKASSDSLDQAVQIIRNRIDGIGVAEPNVARQGSNILVELPGVKDRDTARAIVGRTAELQFRLVDQAVPLSSLNQTTGTTATTAPGDTSQTTAPGDTSQTTAAPTTAAPTTAAATTGSGGALGASGGAPILAQAASTTTAAATTSTPPATAAGETTVPGDTSQTTATTAPGETTTTVAETPTCAQQAAEETTTTAPAAPAGPASPTTATTAPGDTSATTTAGATTTTAAATTTTAPATTASGGALGGSGGAPVLAQAASTTTPTTTPTTATTGATTATTATGATTASTATGDTTATTAAGETSTSTPGGIPQEILEGTGCLDATQGCYTVDKDHKFLLQLEPSALSGRSVRDPQASFRNQWVVTLDFDSTGTDQWAALTSANVGKQVAIVLDGVVQSFPTINNAITSGQTEISGSFSEKDAKDLALVLRYGALPVRLEELTAQEVSATLGKDQLHAGIWAGVIGLAIVTIYMVAMYRVLGLLVLAGLAVTGLEVWAVIAYLGEKKGLTLTLAGVTGLIVSLGIAVDSFIVYFERLKDELKAGASVRSSVERGFRKAWRTILAADLVSLIGAILLYLLAVGAVRGFAFYLGLATLLDLLVAYFFMYPMTAMLSRNRRLARSKHFGLGAGLHVAERAGATAPGAAAGSPPSTPPSDPAEVPS